MAKIIDNENHLASDIVELSAKKSFWIKILIGSIILFFIAPPIGFLAVVFSGMQLNKYSKNIHVKSVGLAGEERTQELIMRLPDTYTAISDISVEYENKTSQLDHVIVGPTGVFVVETKNLNGEIVGNAFDHELQQNKIGRNGGEYSRNFYNPIKQVGTHVYRLSGILKDHNIKTWVQGIVYFSNPDAEVHVDGDKIPVFSYSNGGSKDLINYILDYDKTPLTQEDQANIIDILEA